MFITRMPINEKPRSTSMLLIRSPRATGLVGLNSSCAGPASSSGVPGATMPSSTPTPATLAITPPGALASLSAQAARASIHRIFNRSIPPTPPPIKRNRPLLRLTDTIPDPRPDLKQAESSPLNKIIERNKSERSVSSPTGIFDACYLTTFATPQPPRVYENRSKNTLHLVQKNHTLADPASNRPWHPPPPHRLKRGKHGAAPSCSSSSPASWSASSCSFSSTARPRAARESATPPSPPQQPSNDNPFRIANKKRQTRESLSFQSEPNV